MKIEKTRAIYFFWTPRLNPAEILFSISLQDSGGGSKKSKVLSFHQFSIFLHKIFNRNKIIVFPRVFNQLKSRILYIESSNLDFCFLELFLVYTILTILKAPA